MGRAPKHCGRGGCTELVRGRTYCDEHEPEAWAGAGRGSTREWRKLREQVLREERWCRDCGVRRATEAGHIVAKALGGSDTRSNLRGQCSTCNAKQNVRDRRLLRR